MRSGEYLGHLGDCHIVQKVYVLWSWVLKHVAHFDTGGWTYTRCVKRMIQDLCAVCSRLKGRERASLHLTTCWRPVPPQALTHWEFSLHSSVHHLYCLAARRANPWLLWICLYCCSASRLHNIATGLSEWNCPYIPIYYKIQTRHRPTASTKYSFVVKCKYRSL
jgi:hypothetical protein